MSFLLFAVRTRLELVTSCVTGSGAYETRTRDLLRDRQAF